MNHRIALIAATAVTALYGSASFAADDIGKDLKATIALQGMACDQIVSTKRNADSDYNVVCKDGNRYHVYVSDKGRVVVKKQ